jgi:hypothetical protein
MANKLLRTVKRIRTARKILAAKNVSIFQKTIHGYRQNGEVSSNVIQARFYEVYEGEFYNYQGLLKNNETILRLK